MKPFVRVVLPCMAVVLLASSQGRAAVFNSGTGHWYDIVNSGANGSWANAENNAVGFGGHLVTINDAAEEAWLRSTFGMSTRRWIGFTDAASEGTWVWASGEAVTYTNWNGIEPNNAMPPSYGEDYAVINWNTSTGGWNDWDHLRPDYSHVDGIAEFTRNPAVPEPATCVIWSLLAAIAVTCWRRHGRRTLTA